MSTTAGALFRLLRPAHALVVRTELALTIAQIAFWTALTGVPVGLVLQARRRRTHGESLHLGEPSGVASDTSRTRFVRPDGREVTSKTSISEGRQRNG